MAAGVSVFSALDTLQRVHDMSADAAQHATHRAAEVQLSRAVIAPRSVTSRPPSSATQGDFQYERGWVTRVLEATSRFDDVDADDNVGVFVLDEYAFSMNQHRMHGIELDHLVVYQLDGIYVAETGGIHQMSVQFSVEQSAAFDTGSADELQRKPVCYARSDVSGNEVFAGRANFVKHLLPTIDIRGDAELARGLHPISMRVFCDAGSLSPAVKVSFKARAPDSQYLNTADANILHLASPPRLVTDLPQAPATHDVPGSLRPPGRPDTGNAYFYASR